MKFTFDSSFPKKAECLVLGVFEGGKLATHGTGIDKKTQGALSRIVKLKNFKGKKSTFLGFVAPAGAGADHIVLMGLGPQGGLKVRDFEGIGSGLVTRLNADRISHAVVALSDTGARDAGLAAAHVAFGARLNAYRFDKYLTKEKADKKPTLARLGIVVREKQAAVKAFATLDKIVDGVFLTRDLVSEPPNVIYPESFAARARAELVKLGVKVTILDRKAIEKFGMGALMAVAQGSARDPRIVIMEWNGGKKGAAPVAFVGKGVTFDTGGISIKPAAGMEDMKWDMAGAGAVAGLMKALAGRGARVNAVGVAVLAENMPSGTAARPSDIVRTMSGMTVEILNTDAEGRLILCDALWYVQEKHRPSTVIDLATLTGAMVIALGHEFAGVFSNDETLARNLMKTGEGMDERVWQLPLCEAWDKALDSPAADIKNISGGRDAGSATAASFLKRFIKDKVKWAHLDIAGVAWTSKDRPCVPKGAAGWGVRLLDRFVAEHLE